MYFCNVSTKAPCIRPPRSAILLVIISLIIAQFAFMPSMVLAQNEATASASTDTTELQGILSLKGDTHMLGIAPAEGASEIIVTLIYKTVDTSLIFDGANFSILTEDALLDFLSGTPLEQVPNVDSSVLRAAKEGTIVQATIPLEGQDGFTAILENGWQSPVRYVLTVHGGLLIDEAGQTLAKTVPHYVPSEGPVVVAQPHLRESGFIGNSMPVIAEPDIVNSFSVFNDDVDTKPDTVMEDLFLGTASSASD